MTDSGIKNVGAPKKPLASAKARSNITQIFKQLICIGMVVIVILPILLTVFASFKTKGDMVNTSPLLLPEHITLENYKKVFTNKYLLRACSVSRHAHLTRIFSATLRQFFLSVLCLYMPGNKTQTLTTFPMNCANAQQGSWQTLAAGIVIVMLPTILL